MTWNGALNCPECNAPALDGFCAGPHPDYDFRQAIRRGDVTWSDGSLGVYAKIVGPRCEITVTGEPTRIMRRRVGRPRQEVGEATGLRCLICNGRVLMQGSLRWCDGCAFEWPREERAMVVRA